MIIGFFLQLSFQRPVFDLTTVLLLWYELFSTNLVKWTFDWQTTLYIASFTVRCCHFLVWDSSTGSDIRDILIFNDSFVFFSVMACRTSHWQSPSVFPLNSQKSENTSLSFLAAHRWYHSNTLIQWGPDSKIKLQWLMNVVGCKASVSIHSSRASCTCRVLNGCDEYAVFLCHPSISIHPSTSSHRLSCAQRWGGCWSPSQLSHCEGWLHPGQVASSWLGQHGETNNHSHSHRRCQFASCACLWTAGGSRTTWREPTCPHACALTHKHARRPLHQSPWKGIVYLQKGNDILRHNWIERGNTLFSSSSDIISWKKSSGSISSWAGCNIKLFVHLLISSLFHPFAGCKGMCYFEECVSLTKCCFCGCRSTLRLLTPLWLASCSLLALASRKDGRCTEALSTFEMKKITKNAKAFF